MAAPRSVRDPAGAMSLFWRVFAINAAVLVSAALLLVLTPATVSPEVRLVEVLC
jgi:hypothetical protein